MNKKYVSVDNQDQVTLESFIKENTAEDVMPLTNQQINDLESLEIGDIYCIGICEIKRVI